MGRVKPRKESRVKGVLGLIGILIAGSASAQDIDINASDFSLGTNISNAIPGVTLSYASIPPGTDPQSFPTLAAIPYTSSPLTIQSETFGYGNFNTLGGDTGGLDGVGPGGVLLEFTHPIDGVSFVTQDFDGDATIAALFDSSGNQVITGITSEFDGGCVRSPLGGCEYFNTGGAIQSTTPISAIVIGGSDEEAFILSIDAHPVAAPEIDSSSATSALMLLLGSFMVLRSRRPNSETCTAIGTITMML